MRQTNKLDDQITDYAYLIKWKVEEFLMK